MRVLVTGAAGQLGMAAVQWLQDCGHDVVPLGREQMDVTVADSVLARIGEHAPDWVLNCAAYTAVDRAEDDAAAAMRVNVAGAREVAKAVAAAGCRLLHLSSDFVFDGALKRPLTESDSARPLGVYGQSKLAGEAQVRAHLPEALIVRTAWLFGANGNNFLRSILRQACALDELRVVADQTGSPTWTGDVCRVLEQLMRIQTSGLLHCVNAGQASWFDFAAAVVDEARIAGLPVRVRRVIPVTAVAWGGRAQRPAFSVLDTTRLSRLLDAPLPHWRARVRRVVAELAA